MKRLALLPLLALAGCGWFSATPGEPVTERRPEYVACQREVAGSPEMRALAAQANVDNALNAYRLDPERKATESRLYRDCLRRRGLALPGGVESVRVR